jgi:transglutaminase-like putative cysteine protease
MSFNTPSPPPGEAPVVTHHPPSSLTQHAPRELLVAATLYWGMANESLLPACIISLVLIGQYFIRWRWEFSDNRFTDMFHLCLLILLCSAVTIWSATNDGFQTFITLFRWLPLVFIPLFGAQIYSTAQTVSLKTFFQALGLKEREEILSGRQPTPIPRIALDYPYFILVMAAASGANKLTWPYYVATIVLVSWAVWQRHSQRVPVLLTVGVLLLVSAFGYGGQLGLFNLQRVVENWSLFSPFDDETNLKMSTTAIGSVRDVRLGGKVVLRVKKHKDNPAPLLLQEATYSNWSSGKWSADRDQRLEKPVEGIPPQAVEGRVFPLVELPRPPAPPLPERAAREYVTTIIGTAKTNQEALLALPPGTRSLSGMPAMILRKTPSGAVRVAADRPAYALEVRFNPEGPRFDQSPLVDPLTGKFNGPDASLPEPVQNVGGIITLVDPDRPALRTEVQAIRQLAQDLGLERLPPAEAAARIRAYFQENFSYSLSSRNGTYQSRNPQSPLVNFLRNSREGHCEYYATATVLLLRAAGIPARYAVGYSVQEYSSFERLYLVRSLHAHAWAVAYWDGAWHEVDATPAGWAATDSQRMPLWQPVRDFFAALWSGFNQWRANGGGDRIRAWAPWVVFLLLLVIGGKSLFGKGSKRRLIERKAAEAVGKLGLDSAFYPVMEELATRYGPPVPGETPLNWLKRLRPQLAPNGLPPLLDEVLEAHYRYRFDPQPMSAEETSQFQTLAERCLALIKTAPAQG